MKFCETLFSQLSTSTFTRDDDDDYDGCWLRLFVGGFDLR